MATKIRYVNTASSGGDGTTNNTSGATAAYASLSACETAERGSLTGITCDVNDEEGATTIALDIICTGTAADSTRASFSAQYWTTNATHRIRIRAATGDECNGKFDTNKYRIDNSSGSYANPSLRIVGYTAKGLHVDIQDIAIKQTGSDGSAIELYSGSTTALDVRVYRCFLQGTKTGTLSMCVCANRSNTTYVEQIMLQNCILYGADYGIGEMTSSTAATKIWRVYNCTSYDCTKHVGLSSINNASAIVEIKNHICQVGSSQFTGPTSATTTYDQVLTGDTSSPTVALRSKTVTFVDSSNANFALAAADTSARNQGTDLSGQANYPFSNDVTRSVRVAPWDLGAFEYTGGISGTSVTLRIVE